jgi:hypothetical protein
VSVAASAERIPRQHESLADRRPAEFEALYAPARVSDQIDRSRKEAD